MLESARIKVCSSFLRVFSIYLVFAQVFLPICQICDAKPSPAGSLIQPKETHGESRILADTPSIGLSRLFFAAKPSPDSASVASPNGDGESSWQASARLPTEHTSGGNENSRPKTDLLTPTTTVDGQRTPTTFSHEDKHTDDAVDNVSSSRQRNNRRLHKLGNVNNDDQQELSEGGGMVGMDDGGMHTDENDEEEPLVQSLTAMASHLIEQDDSLENSSEKDVYILNHGGAQQRPSQQENDKSQNGQHSQAEDGSGAGPEIAEDGGSNSESQLPVPSASKTLVPNPNSPWYDEDGNLIPRTTTPKGLTTWSAVNSGESGFKGTVQKVPSDYTVSGLLAFAEQHRQSSTSKPGQISNVYPTPEVGSTDVDYGTTEIARTTNINSAQAMAIKRKKQQPPTVVYNRYKPRPRPVPTKFIKPQLEDVVATPISQDATHTTFQVVPASSYDPEKKAEDVPWIGSRYSTRKPQWPRNPTTPKPSKKVPPFSKVTKRPLATTNPYLKRTQMPILTLTTPTPTTTTQASSTVYYTRNPVAAGVSPFINVHWSNMPFFDFLRTQIIPRIGLSLLSFAATSPLIFTLLSAGAGRKKRDISNVSGISETTWAHAQPRTFDLTQLLANIGLSKQSDTRSMTADQKPSRQWHRVTKTKVDKPHPDSNVRYRFKWNNYKKATLSKKNVKYTRLT